MGIRTFNNGNGIIGTDFDEELDYKGRQPNQIDSVISSSLTNEILFNSTVTFLHSPTNTTAINNDGGVNQILFGGNNPEPLGLTSGLGGRINFDTRITGLPLEINIDLGDDYLFNVIQSFYFIDTTYALSWVPKTMEIKVSNDGSIFTTVFEQTSNNSLNDSILFSQNGTPLYKRYIKLIITSIGSDYISPSGNLNYSNFDTTHISINELNISYSDIIDTNSSGDYIAEEIFEVEAISYDLITEKHKTLNTQWNMTGFTYPENLPLIPALFCYLYNTSNVTGLTEGEMQVAILKTKMQIFKNNEGLFYWPEFNFDGIGTLKVGQGYTIRIHDDGENTTFLGSNGRTYNFILKNPERAWRVPVDNSLDVTSEYQYPSTIQEQVDFVNYNNTKGPSLHTQWNTIAFNRYTKTNDAYPGRIRSVGIYTYLLLYPNDNPHGTLQFPLPENSNYSYYITELSKPINSRSNAFFQYWVAVIEIVKNNEGLFYWPEFGFDGIGTLIPGQGYMVRISDDANLENLHNKLYNLKKNEEGNWVEIYNGNPDYVPYPGEFKTYWPGDDPAQFVGINLLADFPGIT